jgi:electron transfer flavoprotein alpha subunit
MAGPKNIWVLPEIGDTVEASSKTSLGLLSEARDIASKVGGSVTALVFTSESRDYSEVLARFGITGAYIFNDSLFINPSAEAYAAVLLERLCEEKPWLFLAGDTPLGRDLLPLLAVSLDTGLITGCARIALPTTTSFTRKLSLRQAIPCLSPWIPACSMFLLHLWRVPSRYRNLNPHYLVTRFF